MASWNSKQKGAVNDVISILIGVVIALLVMALVVSDAGASASLISPAETQTPEISVTWGPTPLPPTPAPPPDNFPRRVYLPLIINGGE